MPVYVPNEYSVFPLHAPVACQLVDHDRGVRKRRVLLSVRTINTFALMTVDELHLIAIGEHDQRHDTPDIPLATRPVSDRLHNDFLFDVLLAPVHTGCKFRQAEHIHDTVVADFITGTKISMRVIVKSTPANRSGNALIGIRSILDPRMAQCMLHYPFLLVKTLGRVHMPVIFRYQIRDWMIQLCNERRLAQACRFAIYAFCIVIRIKIADFLRQIFFVPTIMNKIIYRIYIFQQLTAYNITHTTRSTGRI
ncbi:hypothetical protein D3C74_189170 [compost metagenome]